MKISLYISDISCIKTYGNDIGWRNIDQVIFREISPKIVDISPYIDDMVINLRYFPIFWVISAWSTWGLGGQRVGAIVKAKK